MSDTEPVLAVSPLSLDVTALAISFISAFVAAISCWFSVRANNHQKRESAERHQWDEYKETVYDPLHEELQLLKQIARNLRKFQNCDSELVLGNSLLEDLGQQLNELTITCREPDNHSSTVESGWVEFSEAEGQKIHDFIEYNGLMPVDINGTSRLDTVIQGYVENFNNRLRKQRKAMNRSEELKMKSRSWWRRLLA